MTFDYHWDIVRLSTEGDTVFTKITILYAFYSNFLIFFVSIFESVISFPLYGDHRIFGYVTVLNQKIYFENCLCVIVNITLLLYIEKPKMITQR